MPWFSSSCSRPSIRTCRANIASHNPDAQQMPDAQHYQAQVLCAGPEVWQMCISSGIGEASAEMCNGLPMPILDLPQEV